MSSVLVVGGDTTAVAELQSELERAGYAAVVAQSSAAALDVLERHAPDLLLFDLSQDLLQRIRSTLARGELLRGQVGPIAITPGSRLVVVEGAEVELTAVEFRLLTAFMWRVGRVATRAALLREVWRTRADATTRTLDTHVNRLRDKLGEWRKLIRTVHGIGYLMVDPDEPHGP